MGDGATPQPAARRWCCLHEQLAQPQPPPRPAELPRGLDRRVGLHRGARDRRLPRRRRGGRRTRRAAAHGAVRDPRPAAVADRRPRAPGTGAHPGVHRARRRDGRRRRGRRGRRSLGGDLRARRAVDDRRHPLSPGALRAPAVAVPHRHELASANMVRGLLDSAATLVGPLVAAVLLQFTGVDVVFWVAAGASFVAAALLVGLRYDAPPRPPAPSRPNLAGRRPRVSARSCRTAT